MKKKAILVKSAAWFALAACLFTGCGQAEAPEEMRAALQRPFCEMTGRLQEGRARLTRQGAQEKRIDFPFSYFYYTQGYTLWLTPQADCEDAYDLKLRDKTGRVLQQLPVGRIENRPEYAYEDLNFDAGPDLEIFDGVPAGAGRTVYLLLWDEENGRFVNESIRLEDCEEIKDNRLSVLKETEKTQTRILYQISDETQGLIKLREWTLQKDTGTLKMQSCLEEKCLFEKVIETDEDGWPLNKAYYNALFWDALPRIAAGAGVDGEDGGYIKETQVVRQRQALLAQHGFAGAEPFYTCYDFEQNPQVECYLDTATGRGLTLRYLWRYANEGEKTVRIAAEGFDKIKTAIWRARDPFALTTAEGENGAEQAKDFEERFTYTQDGRLKDYSTHGLISWQPEDGTVTFVHIAFLYRDDGSLFSREYAHNMLAYETTGSRVTSLYDEAERVIFTRSYVTHGWHEVYYIYTDTGARPAYCLLLDDNAGGYDPQLTQYASAQK